MVVVSYKYNNNNTLNIYYNKLISYLKLENMMVVD